MSGDAPEPSISPNEIGKRPTESVKFTIATLEQSQILRGARAVGGLADLLHGRKQEPDQDRDDRDHDEQLDQGEPARTGCADRRWLVSHRTLLG